jgi:uncharacterized membrane protein
MTEPIRVLLERTLGGFFVGAGLMHFVCADLYLAMMPVYLPWHETLVYLSGAFEVVGGLGVLFSGSRQWAGIGLIALLIAIFPANVHVALHHLPMGTQVFPQWILWLRLPLQLLFIQWVAVATLYTDDKGFSPSR